MSKRIFVVAALLTVWGGAVQAADRERDHDRDLQGVVSLSASANAEVSKDVMTVTLTTTRDGPDAVQVQAALKQALDAALTEARKAVRPGQVDVATGNFSLYPRYGAPASRNAGGNAIVGWQGSAELVVEGRDMPAIAALTGRIGSMTIGRVGYTLSRQQREKVEGDVAAQAIAAYRAKAAETARQFGYGSYVIRQVEVSSGESSPPMPMMRAQAMAVSADQAPLPVEPGKGTVTVTVSGSVQMK